ncbi:MAG TPA: long-chain-fatty-acid--CoA ligase [Stellaceae bacterium]|jgi:fatty-acyl-CoA synthase|nr:long-chain-fatty-acid--CoA ligase [Stellaceae bacterium]
MLGLMSERPLLISTIIAHAATYHGDAEIVSRTVEGPIHRYTYREAERRAQQLARALLRLGIEPGDRVGTLAWNTYRHVELYYAISGIGAVCHTINPRLFDEQIVYIVNHAADRLLFVDATFLPLVERLAPHLPRDCRIVPMTDAETAPATGSPAPACYEELLAAENADFTWPEFDERTAAALCYTSGTTGNPKGALYSHRSTVLHAFGISLPDAISISAHDVVCPVVPLFHACGWGIPYAAPMNGAKLVLPGPRVDGQSLYELFEAEGVTYALGVPTVWLGFEAYLVNSGARCSTLHRILSGGSAVARWTIEAFARHGIDLRQGWGMTEMSPLGTTAALKAKHRSLDQPALVAVKARQGRPVFGVEMKIVDDAGHAQPHDGRSMGELLVRGPWVVSGYFADEAAGAAAVEPDGWFHTGDMAVIDPDGYMQITDRKKDVIKSGGEWISSIDLENAVIAHCDVAEAAVIAVPDPRWGERPLLVIMPRPGCRPEREALIALLARQFPKWMLPGEIVTIDEMPHTATGKIMKTRLRELFCARNA